MILVLHNTERLNYDFDGVLPVEGDLDLVAAVETDDLDVAWVKTNSVEDYWWNNSDVTPLFTQEGVRSTCVGDVMLKDNEAYIVASCGFKRWEEGDELCELWKLVQGEPSIT